ncbi:unnamed protein product [Alopecurus aequalis]
MAARPRRSTHHRPRPRLPHHLLLIAALLLIFLLIPLSTILFRRANSLGRQCLSLASPHAPLAEHRLSFSIVTLSDENSSVRNRRRSFHGMLNAIARNRRAYAAMHGYGLAVLPPQAVDPSRPPAWSKVLALRAHLHCNHWVFWNDADTLVTNPDIPFVRKSRGCLHFYA